MRRLPLALIAALWLAGCPEDRGYTRQRVPAQRVPAAVAVEPTVPRLPPPPAPPGEPAAAAPPVTSGR